MRVYLDHAATTPLRPHGRAAMAPWLDGGFGNASSVHATGRAARAAVEEAREAIAAALGFAPLDVVFTAGATEADNLAVLGIVRASGPGAHLVVSAIEHHAVLEAAAWLEER